MKLAKFITAILFIFFFNSIHVLSDNNYNLSKNNIEQARSIFKQIEKGDWKYAIRKAKKSNNKMLEQLVYWLYLNKKMNNATFQDYQNFIKKNPKIPNINHLKYLSEYKINIKSIDPKFIINYFKINKPLSSYGKIKLGEALINITNSAEGKKLIKSSFKTANLGNQDIFYLTKTYKNIIGLQDIINRAEWLAWENKTQQLKHLFKYLPKDYKALYKARYLLTVRSSGVDYAVRSVPDKYKNNQGLLYQRIKWKLRTGKIDSALKLLLKAKKDPKKFNRPDKFWKPTSIIIRHQVYKKNYLVAYQLASQHYLDQGLEYVNAEWLSGWIALKFINEPKKALNHFLNMAKNADDPKSRSRAAYWCGKTYEKLNLSYQAKEWYFKSSVYSTAYYGQLGHKKIFPDKKFSLSNSPIISQKIENDFNNNQWVQAVKILKAINRTHFSKNILDYLSKLDNKVENEFLASQLAMDIGRKDYAMRIAKKASYHKRYYNNLNYPVLNVPKIVANKKMPPAELILAVIRQESEFYIAAQSNKGALGLMQIMPSTARDVAKKTRVWYNAGKLIRDQKYNMNLGSYYLQMMLDRYEGSYPLALAAYNAGHRRVDRWLKINGDPRKDEIDFSHWIELIPFKETRNYVQRVLANVNVYKFILTKQPIKLSIF